MSSGELASLLPGLHPLLCGPSPHIIASTSVKTEEEEHTLTTTGSSNTGSHAAGSSQSLTGVHESYVRWRRCFLVWRKLLGSDVMLLALLLHAGCVWMPDYAALHACRTRCLAALASSSSPVTSPTQAERNKASSSTDNAVEDELEREITQAWRCHVLMQRAQPASVWALHVLHYLRLLEVYETGDMCEGDDAGAQSQDKRSSQHEQQQQQGDDEDIDGEEDGEADVITISSSSSSSTSSSPSHSSSHSSVLTSSSQREDSVSESQEPSTATSRPQQPLYECSGSLLPLYLPAGSSLSPVSGNKSSPTCTNSSSTSNYNQKLQCELEYMLGMKATVTVIDSDEPLVQRVASALVDEWVELLTLPETDLTHTDTSTTNTNDSESRAERVQALRAYWFASALKFAAYVDASQSALLEENVHVQALLKRQAIPLASALELCCKSVPSILHCFLIEEATAAASRGADRHAGSVVPVGLCMPPMAMLTPSHLLGPKSRVSIYLSSSQQHQQQEQEEKERNETRRTPESKTVSAAASTRRSIRKGIATSTNTVAPRAEDETKGAPPAEEELVPCVVLSCGFAPPREGHAGQLRLRRLDEDYKAPKTREGKAHVEQQQLAEATRNTHEEEEGDWWSCLSFPSSSSSSSSSSCTLSSSSSSSSSRCSCGFLRIDQAMPRRLFMRSLPARDTGTAAWSTNTTTSTISCNTKSSNKSNSHTSSYDLASAARRPALHVARRRLREKRTRQQLLRRTAETKQQIRLRSAAAAAARRRARRDRPRKAPRAGLKPRRKALTRRTLHNKRDEAQLVQMTNTTAANDLQCDLPSDLFDMDLRNETLIILSGDAGQNESLRTYMETTLQVQLAYDTNAVGNATTTTTTSTTRTTRRGGGRRRQGLARARTRRTSRVHTTSSAHLSAGNALHASSSSPMMTMMMASNGGRLGMSRHSLGALLLFLFTTARRVLGMRGLLGHTRTSSSASTAKAAVGAASSREMVKHETEAVATHVILHNNNNNKTTSAANSSNNTITTTSLQEQMLLMRCASTLGLTALLVSHNLPDELREQPGVILWTAELASFLVDLCLLPERPVASLLRLAGYGVALVPNASQAALVALGFLATLGQREMDCIEGGSSSTEDGNRRKSSCEEGEHVLSGQTQQSVRTRVPWWSAFRYVVLHDATLGPLYNSSASEGVLGKMTANVERCIAVAMARKRQPWRSAARHGRAKHVLVSVEETNISNNSNNNKNSTSDHHGKEGAGRARQQQQEEIRNVTAADTMRVAPHKRARTHAREDSAVPTSRLKLLPTTPTEPPAPQPNRMRSTNNHAAAQDRRSARAETYRPHRPFSHLAWERNTPLNTTNTHTNTSSAVVAVKSNSTTTNSIPPAPRLYTDLSSTSRSTLGTTSSSSTSYGSKTNDSTSNPNMDKYNNNTIHTTTILGGEAASAASAGSGAELVGKPYSSTSGTFITPVRTWQGSFVRGPAVVRAAESCTVCVEDITSSSTGSTSVCSSAGSNSSSYAYEPTRSTMKGDTRTTPMEGHSEARSEQQAQRLQQNNFTTTVQPTTAIAAAAVTTPGTSDGRAGRRKYVSLAQVLRAREQRMLQAAASALYLSLESTTLAGRSVAKPAETQEGSTSLS